MAIFTLFLFALIIAFTTASLIPFHGSYLSLTRRVTASPADIDGSGSTKEVPGGFLRTTGTSRHPAQTRNYAGLISKLLLLGRGGSREVASKEAAFENAKESGKKLLATYLTSNIYWDAFEPEHAEHRFSLPQGFSTK